MHTKNAGWNSNLSSLERNRMDVAKKKRRRRRNCDAFVGVYGTVGLKDE